MKKQLVIVLTFCTFAYGFLLPGYMTLKSPQPDPDQREAQRKSPPRDVQAELKVLIKKFYSMFRINKVKVIPFPWQKNIPNFDTGIFTPRAWLKVIYVN